MPLSASFFLPIIFIYFNVFTALYWSGLLFKFTPPFTKTNGILFFIFLGSLSYFSLYHKYRYKSIFAYFDNQENNDRLKKRYQTAIIVYITISAALFLLTLVSADIRADGHL